MFLLWLIGRDQVLAAQIVADQEVLAQPALGGVGIAPGERQENLAMGIDQVCGDGGLAQHRPADAQRQRQFALGQQPVAGLQFAREKPVAKEGKDPRRAALRLVGIRTNDLEHVVSWSVRGLTRLTLSPRGRNLYATQGVGSRYGG